MAALKPFVLLRHPSITRAARPDATHARLSLTEQVRFVPSKSQLMEQYADAVILIDSDEQLVLRFTFREYSELVHR